MGCGIGGGFLENVVEILHMKYYNFSHSWLVNTANVIIH